MSELPELLEIASHGITAVLATWLGLLVVTRAGRTRGASVFGALCLLLVTWSVAIIVQRVGGDEGVKPAVNVVEDFAAFLLPPITAHIAISIAFEGRRSSLATGILAVGYTVAALAIAQAVLDPTHPIQFSEPSFAPIGIPGPLVAWAFTLVRAGIWGAGIAYLVIGLLQAGTDRARRRQLLYALATVFLGVLGGMLRILPEEVGGPRWIGISLIAVAVVMAAYAVLAQHLFIAADVAARAVRWSVLAGFGIVLYVASLLALEQIAASFLAIEFPLVTTLAVVMTLALFDPVANRVRRLMSPTAVEAERGRLLEALGSDPLLAQAPDRALEPALARLTRIFELTGAAVVTLDGTVRVATGVVRHEEPGLRLPVAADGLLIGHAIFGPKRSGLSFTPAETDALELAVDYLASSMRLAQRHDEQATALEALRAEGVEVESRGSALSEALSEVATRPSGLHVFALGPLRAERDGEPVRRWGGAKAGSRQAEAAFAFLLDRGERGAAKDEFLDLIWPDVDIERADVAFHRTLLGLRSMLQPDRRLRRNGAPITFQNDRYRLDPAAVAWSDVTEFERLLADAGRADDEEAIRSLEEARALYRGEYLDDCPFYGDSADVEERRIAIRRRYVDLLIELGERYIERGDRPAAAACFRDAEPLAEDDLPRVHHGLQRLAGPRAESA